MQVPTPPVPQLPPLPPLTPVAPAIPAAPAVAGQVTVVEAMPGTSSAAAVYQAYRAQRTELRQQLSQLEDRRLAIARRLREGEVEGADKAGLEARLVDLDARIALLDKQVMAANDQVAQAAAVPGATAEPPRFNRDGPPEEAFILGALFIVSVFLPLSIAMARRIWRRSSPAQANLAALPAEVTDRMSRIEEAVEAIAVEVERVGEGQRYLTRLLGPGGAEPLSIRPREAVGQQLR